MNNTVNDSVSEKVKELLENDYKIKEFLENIIVLYKASELETITITNYGVMIARKQI